MLAKKDLLIQKYMYVGELCWWKFWCMLVKSIFNDEIYMLVKDVGENLNRCRTVPLEPSSEVVVTLTLMWS